MSKSMRFSAILLLLCCLLAAATPPGFKSEQLKFPRVRDAFREKEAHILSTLKEKGIDKKGLKLMLLAFKEEQELQLWARSGAQQQFQLLKTYPYCNFSGSLGPKRRQGDTQIPEGFYYIDRFNPGSNFYLSLGINYPNKSDNILSSAAKKGGDIFIHGGCATIGCIPVTDDKIKELYTIAVLAKDQGQEKIPVAIFPAKMSQQNWNSLQRRYSGRQELLAFWQNLKTGYDKIISLKQMPEYSIDTKGTYSFK